MNTEIDLYTEEQCREQISKIQFERIMVSFICGFVVSKVFRIIMLIPDEDNSVIMWVVMIAFIAHNFAFGLLMIHFYSEQKKLERRIVEITRRKREKSDLT